MRRIQTKAKKYHSRFPLRGEVADEQPEEALGNDGIQSEGREGLTGVLTFIFQAGESRHLIQEEQATDLRDLQDWQSTQDHLQLESHYRATSRQ